MTILADSYIHLFYKDADHDTMIVNIQNAKNTIASNKFQKNLSQKYFGKNRIPGERRITKVYKESDNFVKKIISQIDNGEPSMFESLKTGDYDSLVQSYLKWSSKSADIHQGLQDFADSINNLDDFFTHLGVYIQALALETGDPIWMQLADLKDGSYKIADSIFSEINRNLGDTKAIDSIEKLQEKNNYLARAAGWLYEAEFLIAGFKTIQEINKEFNEKQVNIFPTSTSRDFQVNKIEQLEVDAENSNMYTQQILNLMKETLTINRPKADFYISNIGENGFNFYKGISLKSTKEIILEKGKYSYKYRTSLGTTSKTLNTLLEDKDMQKAYPQAKNNLIQAAFSLWKDVPQATPRKVVDSVLDVAATLSLADALVGEIKDFTTPGYTSYLVVNKHIYRTPQILKAAIKAIQNKEDNVVQGAVISNKFGSLLEQAGLKAAQQREKDRQIVSKQEGSSIIYSKAEQAFKNLTLTKVNIDLNLLLRYGLKAV